MSCTVLVIISKGLMRSFSDQSLHRWRRRRRYKLKWIGKKQFLASTQSQILLSKASSIQNSHLPQINPFQNLPQTHSNNTNMSTTSNSLPKTTLWVWSSGAFPRRIVYYFHAKGITTTILAQHNIHLIPV